MPAEASVHLRSGGESGTCSRRLFQQRGFQWEVNRQREDINGLGSSAAHRPKDWREELLLKGGRTE